MWWNSRREGEGGFSELEAAGRWYVDRGSCIATKEGIVLTIFYVWGRRKRSPNETGYSFGISCLALFSEIVVEAHMILDR